MPSVITIFGGSSPLPGSPAYEEARLLGRLLGEAGFTVATGGYMGTMEAASRGAAEAGGHVIGVTCETIERWRQAGPNPWVKEERKFATLRDRLFHLVEACQAAVALPGGIGTLSEIALTWSFMQTREIPAKPLVLVGRLWRETFGAFLNGSGEYVRESDHGLLTVVEDADSAAQQLVTKFPDLIREPFPDG